MANLHINAIQIGKICSNCKSTVTMIEKSGAEHWYSDKNGGKWCKKCYQYKVRTGENRPAPIPKKEIARNLGHTMSTMS